MAMAYMSPDKQRTNILLFVQAQDVPVDRLTISKHLGYRSVTSIHRALRDLVDEHHLIEIECERPNGTIKHYYVPRLWKSTAAGIFATMLTGS